MTQQPPYQPYDPNAGQYPEQQGRPRGGMLPIPHRTWTTQRGTRVTVGGCCLPLPIGCLTLLGAAAAAAVSSSLGRRG